MSFDKFMRRVCRAILNFMSLISQINMCGNSIRTVNWMDGVIITALGTRYIKKKIQYLVVF